MNIPFVNEATIRENVSMSEAILLMKDAFISLSNGEANVPIRTNMRMNKSNSLIMPVYLSGIETYGVKIVSINHENPSRGRPLIHAVFQLMNASTGEPMALFDAEYITALRTGAASGLATKMLAMNEAKNLAVFGSGKQSTYQIEAICSARDIKRIYIFSRNEHSGKAFVKKLQKYYSAEISWETEQNVLSECDIICTATTSKQPVITNTNLKKNVHINGIGSYQPDMAEVPSDIVTKSIIIVDQKETCLNEAGDIIQSIKKGLLSESDIHSELGEICSSDLKDLKEKQTFFKSVGNAVQDLVVAYHVWEKINKKA